MQRNILKITLLAASLFFAAPAMHADVPPFKEQAIKLIHGGELHKAEKLLDGLSKSDRQANVYLIDSLKQIIYRIRTDFSVTPAEGRKQLSVKTPNATNKQIAYWKSKRYIEADTLDGKEFWFRRSVSNFYLLDREDFKEQNEASKKSGYQNLAKYYNEAMKTEPDENQVRDIHACQITFSIDVKADAVPDGETLRVWMPYPYENLRQSDIRLLHSSNPVTFSSKSTQHTAYMEGVAHKGQPTHFEITFRYNVGERHLTRAEILSRLKPYDTSSADYVKYTADQYPHIVKSDRMVALAKSLVGNEKNPVFQSSIVYDWIVSNFPWAGAREYSTIPNIPEYVLDNGHGDCGQVALLYITLMRSLGIPARWESGWMLHPFEKNYHDWAETYFEGVGWVPTDVSFGRSMAGEDLSDYYKTGIDVYRFAANEGINDSFDPQKRYIRCETVDNQAGEVEWSGGNLEYKDWKTNLNIDSFIKIDTSKPEQPWGLVKLSVASLRYQGAHEAEMATQGIMGTPLKILAKADDWYKVEMPDSYVAYVPASSIVLMDSLKLASWRQAKRYIVTAYQSRLTTKPLGDETVSDLVLGNILEYRGESGDNLRLSTPDGREGYVAKADVEELSQWAAQDVNPKQIIATARRMMGSGYLWGGTSTKVTDCSGLAKISYLSNGIILMRDASQQARTGEKIAAANWQQAEPGDLLFFGTASGRVTHVGIYLGNGEFIHCSGRVKINSVDPKAKDYMSTPFISISRINGRVGTTGITALKAHPWYF